MKNPFAQAARTLRPLWQRVAATVSRIPPLRYLAIRRSDAQETEDIRWHPAGETAAEQYAKSNRRFALTRGALWYAVLLVVSLLFTQILRSRASSIFFWFVLLMLPALLIYTLIARHALQASMNTDSKEIEKLRPCEYEFHMTNSSPLAFPFVDAILSLPREDAVRTEEKVVRLSMAPMSTYRVNNTVKFRFRGTYRVGVSCFYVYDFFRLFRIRVDVDCYEDIYVMPRKRDGQGSEAVAIADITTQTTKSPYTYERLEISDIRDYRLGDSLKSVHWKLSSKSEELIVRDYSSGVSNRAVIFCDMAAHFPTKPPVSSEKAEEQAPVLMASDEERRRSRRRKNAAAPTENRVGDADMKTVETDDPTVRAIADEEIMKKSNRRLRVAASGKKKKKDALDLGEDRNDADVPASSSQGRGCDLLAEDRFYEDMNEYCADGVIELTVSSVLRELRNGNRCYLVWFDSRVEGGVLAFDLSTENDFDSIFHLFATAPLCRPEQKVDRLRTMLADTQSIKQIFVIPAPDEATVTEFSDMGDLTDGSSQGAVELLCYEPEERFADVGERRRFMENCRALLGANGIRLSVSRGLDHAADDATNDFQQSTQKEASV
ncbi:MAG: DUF58 domain-containing protein [Clostridia bacterium]|nr:DUF58 domain-containing protein [Clostridia bacterium]